MLPKTWQCDCRSLQCCFFLHPCIFTELSWSWRDHPHWTLIQEPLVALTIFVVPRCRSPRVATTSVSPFPATSQPRNRSPKKWTNRCKNHVLQQSGNPVCKNKISPSGRNWAVVSGIMGSSFVVTFQPYMSSRYQHPRLNGWLRLECWPEKWDSLPRKDLKRQIPKELQKWNFRTELNCIKSTL